jgi:hypothetical protein
MSEMLKNDRPDVDTLLQDYFQAELPKPWPAFQAPMQTRTKPPVSLWSRYSGRIAMAACIAALVAGYLSLASYFPRVQEPTGVEPGSNIARKEKGTRAVLPNPDEPMPMPINNNK